MACFGALPLSLFTPTETGPFRMKLVAVLIWSVALTIGSVAAVYAWVTAGRARPPRRG